MASQIDLSRYDIVFSDEFDTLSLFDGTSGTWSTTGYWGSRTLEGNGERQFYVDPVYGGLGLDPFSISDGVLTISARPAAPEIKPYIGKLDYISGMIGSENTFSMQYGYFEIRAEMPAGQGLWSAFWMLTADGEWPPEYDVVEILGQDPSRLYGTAHYKTDTGTKVADYAVDIRVPFDSSDGFHTYGFDWQHDRVAWYYDGVKVGEAPNYIFDQPMYLIANLGVGGYWPGMPDASTVFPAEMKIDYIRAYQRKAEHDIPGVPEDWEPIAASSFRMLSGTGARVTYAFRDGLGEGETGLRLTGDWSRYAMGNALDNFIAGSGAKYNQLDGGGGDDTLLGNTGIDLFVIKRGGGSDVILDFHAEDKVRLEGFHFKHFADVQAWMTQDGADVVLRLDRDQALLFKDGRIADFRPEQFVFLDSAPLPEPAPDPVPVGAVPGDWGATGTPETYIKGTERSETLQGGDGNDKLIGRGGEDRMAGGGGDDTYVVDSGSDKVVEFEGEGRDLVNVFLKRYVMPANVENLGIYNTIGTVATGNALDNVIVGNTGNDIIIGGGGADKMTGGHGADIFILRKGEAHGDRITDFQGNGDLPGDTIRFEGYGPDARLAGDGEVWTVFHRDGAETFVIEGVVSLAAEDMAWA